MKYPLARRDLFNRSTVADVAILAATLGAMIAINREWLFSRKYAVDSWMYVGYFLHYDSPDFLADNKKIARLPWILLGFMVNKLTSPIIASYILHAGLLAAGAFAFYWVAKRLFSRQAAVLAALAYLTSQLMHGSGAWDYHNTLTPVLYFLAFLSFDSALISGRKPFAAFIVFGVLLALTIHTNLLVVLLGPALLIHGIFRIRTVQTHAHGLRWMLKAAAGLAAGAAAITACLGVINVAFGRQFFFFAPLLIRSAVLLANPNLEEAWWQPWSDRWWADDIEVHTALAEAVLVVVLLFSIAALIRLVLGGRRMKPILVAIYLEYAVSVGLAAALQALGQPILQPDYMAFPLNFPMFLALAGLISQVLAPHPTGSVGLESRPVLVTILAAVAAFAFVAQVSGRLTIDHQLFAWAPAEWHNKIPFLLAILAMVGGALLSRAPASKLQARIGVQIACFLWIAVMLGQANANWTNDPDVWKAYTTGDICSDRRSILSAVVDADRVLFPLLRRGQHVVTWYRGEEDDGPLPSCELATRQLAKPLFAIGYTKDLHYWEVDAAADLPADVIANLTPGKDVLAVISSDPAYVSHLLGRLQQRDTQWHETGTYTVGKYDIKFGLHLITAETAMAARQTLKLEAVPHNGATVQPLPSGELKIRLPDGPWSYAATLLPAGGLDEAAATLLVRLRVVSGTAAIGVLKPDGSDFLAREVLSARAEPVEISLDLSDWRAAGPLLLESAGSPGGEVIVSSLAFAPRSGASTPAP